jgi:hypothetical protein
MLQIPSVVDEDYNSQESIQIIQKAKKYDKPHMIIPDEDMAWALEQRSPVYKLWGECWRSDPYGSRWMLLHTSLEKENLKKAKKALIDAGLFLFENRLNVVDGKRCYQWWVKNLHGSRTHYWVDGSRTHYWVESRNLAAEIAEQDNKDNSVSTALMLKVDFNQSNQNSQVIATQTDCLNVDVTSISNQKITVEEAIVTIPPAKKVHSLEDLIWDGNCLICQTLTSPITKIPRNWRSSFRNSIKPEAYKIAAKVRVSEVHKVVQSVSATPKGSYRFICADCAVNLDRQKKEVEAEALKKATLEQYAYNYRIAESIAQSRSSKKLDFYLRYAFSDEIAQELAAMPYQQFLQTQYWQLIRMAALNNALHRCSMCNSPNQLEVHHRTYKHRGYEFRHLEDLTVVCRPCHASHHGKEA